jgi:flagellar biogenesis protein FliO
MQDRQRERERERTPSLVTRALRSAFRRCQRLSELVLVIRGFLEASNRRIIVIHVGSSVLLFIHTVEVKILSHST